MYTRKGEQKQIQIHNGVQTDRTEMATEKQGHIFGEKQRYAYSEKLEAETESMEQELLLSDTDMITDEWNLPDYLESPIQKGDVIGAHVIFLNGCQILTQPVYAAETVEKFDYHWCLNYVFSNIF